MTRNTTCLLAGAAFGAAALYHGVLTRRYQIQTDKLRPGQHFRAALVADLHSHIFGREQRPLLRAIWRGAPDTVLLAGDIYDNRIPPAGVRLLLEGLRGLPVWYTPGNHEYRTGNFGRVLDLFDRYGVPVLADRWVETSIGGIPVTLAGADDPERAVWLDTAYDPDAAAAAAFSDLPRGRFSMLLAHKPENIARYLRYPFDLVLSGHAHGGQVRIPGVCNGLFASGQGVLPRWTGGCYVHGKTTHVVSRGLSVYWYLPRVCNPPELVLIDVVGRDV